MFDFIYYSLYSFHFYVVLPATLFYFSDLFWKAATLDKHNPTIEATSSPQPEVKDIEFPVPNQQTNHPERPFRFSSHEYQTKGSPKSPFQSDLRYETSPTVTAKPTPHPPIQVIYECPSSPFTNISPDLFSDIASFVPENIWFPPFPAANWSGISENLDESKEVPIYSDICQPQDEVIGEPEDLPLQEPQQSEYQPWFNLEDIDCKMAAPVTVIDEWEDVIMAEPEDSCFGSRDVDYDMEDAEDAFNPHRIVDDMDVSLDGNLVPAPTMNAFETPRPLLWEEQKQPSNLCKKQVEFIRIAHILMVRQNEFQETRTPFARNSLILHVKNLVNQILELAVELQTQRESAHLSQAYADCIRFWTEKIIDAQTHPEVERTQPLSSSSSMMSFSQDSFSRLSESQSAFLDPMVVTWL